MRQPKDQKILRPVHPNLGLEAYYRKRLDALIEEMHRSIVYWVKASYRANGPLIAMDALPAAALEKALRDLGKRWESRFDQMAAQLAKHFSLAVEKRSSAALSQILREGGMSVQFKMTAAMRDVLRATITENIGLIKSIPQQYLAQVQGIVMRSVQNGRDLKQVSHDLQHRLGVTKRRAAFIAMSQNNLATAAMTHARFIEIDIQEAVWVHSHGGKTPRPTHMAAGRSQTKYDVRKGWYDPHEKRWIKPGELPGCRCVARPVLEGFT